MTDSWSSWIRIGGKVLAYHGPLIYEAKILKIHEKNKTFVENLEGKHEPVEDSRLPEELYNVTACFVHYKGWKPKWDEWVPPERLLEFSEANLQVQKELKEISRPKAKTKTKNEVHPTSNGKHGTAPLVQQQQPSTKRKRGDHKHAEVTIEIKPQLKYILVDDWEFITKDRKVVDLPSTFPVSTILLEYRDDLKARDTARIPMDVADEFLRGIKLYFNNTLSLLLLYKFERLQYSNLLKERGADFLASDVYGVEHLLRLFVTLPGLIAQTTMDAVSVRVMLDESKKILDFIYANLSKYLNDYVNVTPAYDSLSRS